jgi:hypothetical protein
MNKNRKAAVSGLRECESYVVLTLVKDGVLRYWCDTRKCENERDVRHEMMVGSARVVVDGVERVESFAARNAELIDEKERVEKAKEARSEEMRKYA